MNSTAASSSSETPALHARWNTLFPSTAGAAAFADIVAHYSALERAYHNLTHLRQVLDTIDELAALLAEPRSVRLAAWFHDVIYDPKAKDNEERSAAHAADVLAGLGESDATIRRVGDLILRTKTHAADPADIDASVMLDADLAILGAAPDDYRAYARAIRAEYAWVHDDAYRAGRTAVLQRFLERPRLFQTAPLFQTRETAARANLRAEIADLALGTNTPGG